MGRYRDNIAADLWVTTYSLSTENGDRARPFPERNQRFRSHRIAQQMQGGSYAQATLPFKCRPPNISGLLISDSDGND